MQLPYIDNSVNVLMMNVGFQLSTNKTLYFNDTLSNTYLAYSPAGYVVGMAAFDIEWEYPPPYGCIVFTN